jgi:hypothetical protein
MSQLPPPINGTEQYLKAIHEELVKLNAAQAAKAAAAESGTLAELKEPKATARKKAT